MRYAIPTSNGKLTSHFGHCDQFTLIDADEASKQITAKEFLTPPPHEPGVLPVWLAEQGVSVVIAGGMGGRAQNIFRENHISVIIGAPEDDPEKVVLNHLMGSLVTRDNICDHNH